MGLLSTSSFQVTGMAKSNDRYCPTCGSPVERYYSVESAALLLDCSQQAIRNWIRDRKIGFTKFGRLVRIPGTEISKMRVFYPSLNESVLEILRDQQ